MMHQRLGWKGFFLVCVFTVFICAPQVLRAEGPLCACATGNNGVTYSCSGGCEFATLPACTTFCTGGGSDSCQTSVNSGKFCCCSSGVVPEMPDGARYLLLIGFTGFLGWFAAFRRKLLPR